MPPCSVPLSAKAAAKRRAALRTKTLRAAGGAPAPHEEEEEAPLPLRLVKTAKAHLHHLPGLGGSGTHDADPEQQQQNGGVVGVDAGATGREASAASDPGSWKLQGAHSAGSASSSSAAAAAAADFVCSLHESPAEPGRWFILGGVSGRARGGEVVGVLGPSGCGKTSLLGSIAGSAMDLGSAAALSGAVTVDGHRWVAAGKWAK